MIVLEEQITYRIHPHMKAAIAELVAQGMYRNTSAFMQEAVRLKFRLRTGIAVKGEWCKSPDPYRSTSSRGGGGCCSGGFSARSWGLSPAAFYDDVAPLFPVLTALGGIIRHKLSHPWHGRSN